MTAGTVVQALADLATQTRRDGLSEALRQDVSRRVLDVLGNCVYNQDQGPTHAVSQAAVEWGGTPQATVIGGARLSAPAAALVNGTSAHSSDFDDTHLPSVLHPSSSVIPAALAVGEHHCATGPQLLDAAGVGIEIAVRLGMGGYNLELGNSVFFERGFHATSICGTFGAAAAASMLMGLSAQQIADALAISASMGSGIIEANRTGGTVKRIHCGWAAYAGVIAAQLSALGLTGPPTAIEGRFGFLSAYCGDQGDPHLVLDGLGMQWELPKIFFKPYPCNHFTHAGIDAALRLRADGIDPRRIERLELAVPTAVLRTIAEPREEKIRPRSGYHAAFSGPYTVAAALLGGGGLGLAHADFSDQAAADPDRLALAAKVVCVPDARCDEIFPNQFPAKLTATMTDQTVHSVRIDANRGGPQHPLSTDELAEKFRLNALDRLDDHACHEIPKKVQELTAAATLGDLMQLFGSRP